MAGGNRIVVLFFHPLYHKSRVNRELVQSAREVEGVNVRIMYDIYPDFHIDMKAEQQVLLEHDVIVWQHPFFWYSAPSLLKEWIDIVLEHGFAYGRTGRALEGKKVMSAISVGGTREIYQKEGARGHTIPQFLLPFERTCDLCHMDYLPPFVIHGTHLLDARGILEAGQEYQQALLSIRELGKDLGVLNSHTYMNDFLTKT